MASVGDLQKALIPNNQTALIEYFVGDSSVFVFSLLQNDLILNELPKTKDFEKQIEALRTEITEHKTVHDATNFDAQSYALYRYLLKQTLDTLPKNLNQLIIVPDGVLNYLPFDVLVETAPSVFLLNDKHEVGMSNVSKRTKDAKNVKGMDSRKSSKDSSFTVHHSSLQKDSSFVVHHSSLTKSFKKSKFILWHYIISYAYSANLLLEQKGMKKDAPELFAGFASKYTSQDTTFADVSKTRATLSRAGAYELPSAKEEVNKISTILGGKVFLNELSTEGVFKTEANRYKILHFAMHSLTDDKDASLSHLLFTLTPQDTTNDNEGEGVMSLARAFFHAGVPSTVTSLWEVDDSKTRDIMIDFYKNLKNGKAKDEALTKAKRDYLDNMTESGTANPYFWAGFVPIGNMCSARPQRVKTGSVPSGVR